jgi:hypothetical protein
MFEKQPPNTALIGREEPAAGGFSSYHMKKTHCLKEALTTFSTLKLA